MWNEIRAGVLAAKGQRFLLLAYNACNACFDPWNTHANFDTKKAWFSAWLSSSCASSQWFLENLQELAHGQRHSCSRWRGKCETFFESLKECPSLSAIGAQPRMMSWSAEMPASSFCCQVSRFLLRRGCGRIGRASCSDRRSRYQGVVHRGIATSQGRGAIASLTQRNCSRRGFAMK